MKNIFLFLLMSSYLFATNINNSILAIHASLVPKLTLMDSKFEQKIVDNKITVVIFYSKINYNSATLLKKTITANYTDGIQGHTLNVKLTPYSAKKSFKANIYYLLPSKKKNIQKALEFAYQNKVLTFSYLSSYLADGSMIALDVGKKVKPIINLQAIKACDISLRPILLKISKIYIKSEVSKL